MHSHPERKHPAHGVRDIRNQATIVFVTVCTQLRAPWAATDEVQMLLQEVWHEASGWLVGRYMIMPDYIHYFAAPGAADVALERWSKYWKAIFSLRHRCIDHVWQTDHWDLRMRSGKHYEEKWDYVRHNRVRKGLVSDPDDWPYREVFELPWFGSSGRILGVRP